MSDRAKVKRGRDAVRIPRAVGVLFVGLLCILMAVFVYYLLPAMRVERAASKRQVRLLVETDYGVLLEACRELMARVDKGELEPRKYFVRPNPDSEVTFFPKAILDLEPITVSIHSERGPVQLVLGGGFHIFGVTALPSGVPAEGEAGDIRLIPGLWYFDTEYDEYPKARRRIQRLVQKGMSAYMEDNALRRHYEPEHSPRIRRSSLPLSNLYETDLTISL